MLKRIVVILFAVSVMEIILCYVQLEIRDQMSAQLSHIYAKHIAKGNSVFGYT